MEKEILLVNDLCGVGKVALSVMIPLLSAQGHIVHNLPTALVSNTLDYGCLLYTSTKCPSGSSIITRKGRA